MEELDTPTQRRIGIHIDEVISKLSSSLESKGLIPMSEIIDIFRLHGKQGSPVSPEFHRNIDCAFELLETISAESDEIAKGINIAMMTLATALLETVIQTSSQAINREMASFKGINARNKALAEAAAQAREVAQRKWADDLEGGIRIGDMAQLVYAELHANGLERFLPKDPDAVRKWIRPVAPSHAMKPGRSKKPG
ncbi:hypothetical protein PMI35_02314 [Pseudomonas sp. GM78]|uniref:hypothetical protein n=1 Tax=Pseudomonas sp. GM78 TaxID=1144337 RepID=UPI0002707A2A|nr:hypothetical protein [Pseudomonas sp. GM78]EJN29860.1 hypothetical protein PMI35_02314 [Pseudomonas sp. GM78]